MPRCGWSRFLVFSCRSVALLAIGILVPILAGCSGEAKGVRTHDSTKEPSRGGTLRMVQEAPATLDPADGDSVYEALPVNQIFDGLVRLDAGMRVIPSLADTWKISRDGLIYEFRLRDGLKFHDGTAVTSEDVLFTFHRLLEPGAEGNIGLLSYLNVIEGAEEFVRGEKPALSGLEALDPQRIRFRLRYPNPSFLEILAADGLQIVPRKYLEDVGKEEFGRRPVGTGPFMLEAWIEDRLLLAANPDYWGGRPYLDRVDLQFSRPGEEADGGNERFLQGKLDVIVPRSEYLSTLSNDPRVRTHRYQELSLAFLGLGLRNAPVDRMEVRQAIAHAINRQVLVADSPQFRREALGLLPPGMTGYSPSPKTLAHDPDRSRRLLAEAGYTAENPVPPLVLYTASRSAAALRTLERIRSDLDYVGIRLDVRQVSWPELGEKIDSGQAPAFLLAMIAGLTDPDSFLRGLFDFDEEETFLGFRDAECERILAKGALELDPGERSRLYRELERQVLLRAPLVPLYHPLGMIATRKGVHGLEPSPAGLVNLRLEKVWIERGGESS